MRRQVYLSDIWDGQAVSLGGRLFRPEELSAFLLKKMKEDAEEFLQEEVGEAIISVPAYFNDKARAATKRAGELAVLR